MSALVAAPAKHRCGSPTPEAVRLQVLDVTLDAPLSLALQWHTPSALRAVVDEAERLTERLGAEDRCLRCGGRL